MTSRFRVVALGFALAVLVGGGLLLRRGRSSLDLLNQLLDLPGDVVEVFETAPPIAALPGPLRGDVLQPGGALTRDGVFRRTNTARERAGRAPLSANATLHRAAERKLADMFARQYFAHDNPDGAGISVAVEELGYAFLRVGENLALGNFADDGDLVRAWLESPGHRENILSPGFTEIGLAVGVGQFEGRRTWLAAQVFALPTSACPPVEVTVRAKAQREEEDLNKLAAELNTERAASKAEQERLEALAAEANRLRAEGNAKVAEGNAEIEEGNRIYRETSGADAARPHWERGEELQREGRAKHAEAKAKEEELAAARGALAERVADFNARLATYTQRRKELKKLVATYNAQVRALKTCVQRAVSS